MAGGPLLWAPQLTPKGSRRPLSSRPAVPFPASIAAWWPNCRAASSRSVFGLLREKRGDGIDAWRLGPASGPVVAASSESGADGPLQKQDFNQFLQFGPYQKESGTPKRTVRVLLSVPFRCHSLQMLCIGGSQFPFGWSFVSIAKLPMTWNPTDIWTAEVELPVGMRLEYKYVILEEQIWTKQEDDEAEGVMELTYRSGTEPGKPPDIQTIRKQMAIVDWQPGPNRVLEVPTEEELAQLNPGETVSRTPAQPRPFFSFRRMDAPLRSRRADEPAQVTQEELSIDEDGNALLKRMDVWPYNLEEAWRSSSKPKE